MQMEPLLDGGAVTSSQPLGGERTQQVAGVLGNRDDQAHSAQLQLAQEVPCWSRLRLCAIGLPAKE